jgi:serine/threonine protein kinase
VTNFDQPFQDYEILDRVGGGAMGTVFKARHKRLNRIVALKILKPSLARDKRYVDRLRREARIVASLSHPHIVTGYDLGEEGGYHFFVMEFVEGKSLRQLLVEWGMFAEEYVLRVAREVAEALDHAYQRDVIHRDIKPGNILIDDKGSVKLTDMGLAKGPADLTLTRDGATVGTPMYISPEQARNPQDVDVRSDLYSLGATLYHMATGVPPFSGNTMAELITNVLNENVVPPDEANSAVSPGLSLVIRKLLAKNLTVRYQTPRELLDDLDRLDKELPPAVDAGRLEAAADLSGRWLRPVTLACGAMLLAFSAWWVGRQMVEPRDAQPDSAQYLSELDRELLSLPSPGSRHLRLATITDAPSGTIRPLEQRRLEVANELQAVLDGVVDEFEGPRRSELWRWLRDPTVWPDLSQFDRERLQPRARQACGIALAQLPVRVRRERVEALRQAVQHELERRDAELVEQFEHYLTKVVPGRANASARTHNFTEAIGHWRVALSAFCDGVRQPLPERLPDAVRVGLNERLQRAAGPAVGALEQAEKDVALALRSNVSVAVGDLRSRLDGGTDPAVVREALQRLRSNLGYFWPAASCFRPGHNPWPSVDQQLLAADAAVEVAVIEHQGLRFEARCDTAWRVFRYGDAAAAQAVLADLEPATDEQKRQLEGHRRCLGETRRVERALLRAIAARSPNPIGFLHGGAEPYALRVEPDGEDLRLLGEAVDQPPRGIHLTELRIGNLLDALGPDAGPLRDIPSGPRALGLTILRLAADDAGGLDRHVEALAEIDRAFVLDEVAPRLENARGEQGTSVQIDLDSMFAQLETALRDVDQGGSASQLRRALMRFDSVPLLQMSGRQETMLRRARQRHKLAQREGSLLRDLRSEMPRGATATVAAQDGALVASVTMPADVLRGGAKEGWQLHGEELEFAGGGRPFAEQPLLALRAEPGMRALGKHTRAEIELTFPQPAVGDRSYMIEFDGVQLIVVLAANDSVQVELIDGPALEEERARRAFAKALSGAFAPAKATAIPGALHRITIDVLQSAPTQAMVKVNFEGKELLSRRYLFDAKLPPSFALHPLQEVSVRELTVRAYGL